MKFSVRLTICMVALITIMYGFGGSLLITLSFKNAIKAEEENAFLNYSMICSTLMVVNSISTQDNIEGFAEILLEQNNKSPDKNKVRLYDENRVFYSSDENIYFNCDLYESLSENECAVGKTVTGQEHYIQVTGMLLAGEKRVFLDVLSDASMPYQSRDIQLKTYRMLFFAVILFSVVISFIVSHFLTGPIRYLSSVSRKISQGNYTLRAKLKGGDEFFRLAEDFNVMAESLTDKIDEQNRMLENQERFVGSFAHEMKTPMTSIIGYADLLRSHDMSEEERRECCEFIFNEAKRLESLSLKLLDLLVNRKHDFCLKEISPSKLLRETAELVNEKLKEADVFLRFSTKKGKCYLEPDLVKSLLINLIDNSIKAMENGGEIVVKQEMIKSGCRFEISDNGRGIPESDLIHIREAFYRVDKSRSRKQGGAGLGLSLCDEIVKLHCGTMEFYSEVGKGTKVVVELRGKADEENN